MANTAGACAPQIKRIIAESGEGYQRKNACYAAIKNLKERVLAASIIEV